MRKFATTLAAASLFALAACGSNDTAKAPEGSSKDLVAAVNDTGELTTVSTALKTTGLTSALEGQGAYTLLAPTDAAFKALGDKATMLSQAENTAALAAVLRNHMLPGALSAEDIGKAIDAAGGKPVTMRTLGSGTASFAREGDGIVVTGEGGAKAKLAGTTVSAKNGAVLPIDAVLAKI